MGELIHKETSTTPLPFSGERLTAAISGQVEIEHYHRYLLAREFCRGKNVLDVAAGEGYGTALLAQVAQTAIGLELDAESVTAARSEFQRPNLRYEQGDARAIPLQDASIDVAVSFETLEHLAEQDLFLSELKRVLRPNGLLIISTPDRDTYSPIGTPPNPFHVLELTRAEFEALLLRHFSYVTLGTQRAVIGSVIVGSAQDVPARSYERRSDTIIEGSDHLPRAPYVIALASSAMLPPLPNSVYVYRSDLDTDPKIRFETEMKLRTAEYQIASIEQQLSLAVESEATMAREIPLLRQEFALAEDRLKRVTRQLEETEQQLEETEQQLEETEQQLKETEQKLISAAANALETGREASEIARRLHAIEASTVWRSTGPLRKTGQRFPLLARILGRSAKLAWWTATLQLPRRYREWRDYQHSMASSLPVPSPEALASTPEEILFPSTPDPVVSVIVPTYGQVSYTLACLKSIAENVPYSPIEVLVVDDAYPGPEDVSLLEKVAGIRLIRNATNLGFLLSCNEAARAVKGRYIYFLNNDTTLLPGAIDALVEMLNARPDVGMAGSKLVFPDGRLQEAGGIIWSDASGWNYGRGEDPTRPEFNYTREVDYCSGASIMVRRELFESLGGFDEALVPAYYEDVDLAFRIREKGMKVVYEPRSVVIHYEGMSHGTDLSTGVKAHQAKNQAWMRENWKTALADENYANAEHVLRARDRAKARKVILVIDHYTPEPDRDAGSRSIMGILDSLVDAGWVVKFWPHNRVYSATYTTALERRGIEVLDERWPGGLEAWMSQNGSELDHLLVVRPDVAADVLPRIMRTTDAILSFYGVDLHFARMKRQAAQNNQPGLLDEAVAMERLERRIWRNFDMVIYPSEEEASVVRTMSPQTLAQGIVPFCFESFPARTGPTEGHSILFVAGFAHPPNVDAAMFLIREVLPALETEIGPVKVVLAGSSPTQAVQDLAGPNVEVTGYVTDEVLSEFYDRHRVAIVPLRFGAGVKGKVVEALSRGLPLVTTSVGSQGIPGLDGVVPVHDDVAGIVAALKRLLIDDTAWLAQSQVQMDFAQRFYSRPAMQRSVLSAFEAAESAAARHHVTAPMEAA